MTSGSTYVICGKRMMCKIEGRFSEALGCARTVLKYERDFRHPSYLRHLEARLNLLSVAIGASIFIITTFCTGIAGGRDSAT